jgi:hypothetical protein
LFSEFRDGVPGFPWLADSRESLIVSVMALGSQTVPRGFVRAHHQIGSIFDREPQSGPWYGGTTMEQGGKLVRRKTNQRYRTLEKH